MQFYSSTFIEIFSTLKAISRALLFFLLRMHEKRLLDRHTLLSDFSSANV